METVQQNGRFTLFSSKFPSNIYSILYVYSPSSTIRKTELTSSILEILEIRFRSYDLRHIRFRSYDLTHIRFQFYV